MRAVLVSSHTGHAVGWDEARELAYVAAEPLRPRAVPLAQALGTVLAEPLIAPAAFPPCDRSAMDGYAVRGPGPWMVIGTIRAGSNSPGRLTDGQAMAVVTGAAVPLGTYAVLPDEDVLREGDRVHGTVGPKRHIRYAGEECRAGEVLLPAGTPIRAAVLGHAAALGLDHLTVIPRPRVAALVTGDELVTSGMPGPGRTRDAIGPMLPGLLHQATALPLRRVPDSRQRLVTALAGAEADLILVSGSSAAGPADHLRPALDSLGASLLVDGVACRPGHPQALAILPDGRLVIGLPGNPLAALTAFLTLAVPAIAGLRGEPLAFLPTAPIRGGLDCHPASTRLVPVRLRDGAAEPVGHGGSAMLRGVAMADALAVVEPGPATAITARLLPLTQGEHSWGV
ncbi:molybdopterin molybdotransferase MoeA [Kribbella deserti]|uniref:Molybdopterin molybdenumtransferase n=1 Tax=Kribbella deserti TaxID=1926257 RepID=A0ABV6QIZ4_9ACTN